MSSNCAVALPTGVSPTTRIRTNHEVLGPDIGARIEQIHAFATFGIDADDVAGFVQIALRAAPADVVDIIRAAVDTCDDVVNMKGPLVSVIR